MAEDPQAPPGSRRSVDAYISVGSNIQPETSILAALPALREALDVRAASRFYANPAYAPTPRPLPAFINGVLHVRTDLSPRALKYDVLRRIEGRLGRRRGRDPYAPRTLDLDLLVYDRLEVDDDRLTLPDRTASSAPSWPCRWRRSPLACPCRAHAFPWATW